MAGPREREINRLRSKRWRLNEKFCRLVNDNQTDKALEVECEIEELDKLISQIRQGKSNDRL